MKILHLVPLHILASGIIAQAITEQRAANEAGLDWDVRLFTDVPLPEEAEPLRISPGRTGQDDGRTNWFRYVADKVSHRRSLYEWLRNNHTEYDVILLRYTTSDLARAGTLRQISTPVVSVHHTFEIPELMLDTGYRRALRVLVERMAAGPNIRASTAVAGVTAEINEYELARAGVRMPSLTFPNGIDVSQFPVAADLRGATPEIVFVASSFVPWHGLDRLLDDAQNSHDEFVLHLVGNLEEDDRARALQDRRIQLHGHLDRGAITEIIGRSWVGLSSFALDRKGMKEACSLKVREYLASGLPTFSGHADRFPEEAVYYRQGKPAFAEILAYAHEMRTLSRDDVRRLSLEQISKSDILVEAEATLKSFLHA